VRGGAESLARPRAPLQVEGLGGDTAAVSAELRAQGAAAPPPPRSPARSEGDRLDFDSVMRYARARDGGGAGPSMYSSISCYRNICTSQ
jgi:hypothetical protein